MMVHPSVILRHAEDVAFLWTQRERMLRGERHSHVERARADSRLEGHLDGLAYAGERGLACTLELLERYKGPGEVFAAAAVAYGLADDAALERILALAEPSGLSRRAMVAASGWHALEALRPRFERWALSSEPRLRRLATGGLAVHRAVNDGWLDRALRDQDVLVRRRAARAAGELGSVAHREKLRALLADHPPVALAAALALARLGEHGPAVRDVLSKALHVGGKNAELAAAALASVAPAEAMGLVRSSGCPSSLASVVVEASGDIAAIPALLAWMDDPGFARRAGQAFATLTGLDLVREGLTQERAADPSEVHAAPSDADADLPWPATWKVTRWWYDQAESWPRGVRYLAGTALGSLSSPPSRDGITALRQLVVTGRPRHRALAARILAEHTPALPLVETRAPATRMRRQPGLAPWLALPLPAAPSTVESA